MLPNVIASAKGDDMDQEYKKEKFMGNLVVTKEVKEDVEFYGYLVDNTLVQFKAELWAKIKPEVEVILDRPTFLEWMFRKRRKVIIKAMDILIDPPNEPEKTVRMYTARVIKGG